MPILFPRLEWKLGEGKDAFSSLHPLVMLSLAVQLEVPAEPF